MSSIAIFKTCLSFIAYFIFTDLHSSRLHILKKVTFLSRCMCLEPTEEAELSEAFLAKVNVDSSTVGNQLELELLRRQVFFFWSECFRISSSLLTWFSIIAIAANFTPFSHDSF